MPDRLRLGVIFGGQSVEHEVSVHSAQAVLHAADPSLYEVVPIADHVVVRADAVEDIEAVRDIEARIGYPAFVTPSNGGSSVGVSKARNREDLAMAIAEAGSIDRKIIVEKFIEGREVECGVL